VNEPLVWLARHGETEWSAGGRHTGRTDVPLTDNGEHQAIGLKQVLGAVRFDLVESSPRQRAMRTAALAGVTATANPDLAEWDYGELEGLTLDQIRADLPGWTIWDGPWPGGETARQVAERADRVLARALALRAPAGQANALFVAHGHILRVITARWLRQPPSAGRLFAIATATISVLGWDNGEPAVECWNLRPGSAQPAQQWSPPT
jgi:probable phosphoglycerate mutase